MVLEVKVDWRLIVVLLFDFLSTEGADIAGPSDLIMTRGNPDEEEEEEEDSDTDDIDHSGEKKPIRHKNTKQNHVNNKTEIFGSLFVFSYGGEQRGRRLWKLPDWEEGGGSGPKQKVCRAWRTLTSDLWPADDLGPLTLSRRKETTETEWRWGNSGTSCWFLPVIQTITWNRRVKIPPSVAFRHEIWTSCVIRWPLTSDLWPGPAVKLLLSVAPSL